MMACPFCDSVEISLVQDDPEGETGIALADRILRGRMPVAGVPIRAYCRSCEREFDVPDLHRIGVTGPE